MFLTFASGLLAGVLSGILFAFAFTWDAIGELESGSVLLTAMTWIVPTIYGSVFAVGYAFLATSGVTIIFPLVSWITRQPTVAHALTTCFVLSAVFYLWQSPTTHHATMIEFGSYKGCCFLSAGLVTQTSFWNSGKS